MKLALEEVRHVARLARLALTPEEEERYARQLGQILSYARQLEELDTSAVAPTWQALAAPTPLAEDEPRPSLHPDQALACVPDRRGDSIAVPRILD